MFYVFFIKKSLNKIHKNKILIKKAGENVTQEEVRELYRKRTEREKQCYISKVTKINSGMLSLFKSGRLNLYPDQLNRLEEYLTNNH